MRGIHGARIDATLVPAIEVEKASSVFADIAGRRRQQPDGDRVGERKEFRSRRNTDVANVFGIEGTVEVDSQTVRFAAHTEQRGVGRRSIEALVERRRTGRHEFGLRTRQRELPPQVRELSAMGVVRVDQLEPRPIGDGHEAERSAHV